MIIHKIGHFRKPVLAKDWSGMRSLWQEYVNNPLNDVYVVPLPYYYKDYDGSSRKVCYEANDFLEDVPVLDYNLLTVEYLEMLHPEVIVIQNPYDSWNPAISVPELFYSANLRKYTDELVYVPPFEVEEYSKSNEREYSNMGYYVTMPGVVYADKVIVQSEKIREVYIEKLSEFAGEDTKEVWEKRVVACDWNVTECVAKSCDSKKKLLYVISRDAYTEDDNIVQSKIERNRGLFEACSEKIDVTVVHFPNEEYAGCHVEDFDAYYGDVTPLVMAFREAGKPVMLQDYDI